MPGVSGTIAEHFAKKSNHGEVEAVAAGIFQLGADLGTAPVPRGWGEGFELVAADSDTGLDEGKSDLPFKGEEAPCGA